jgi:hypothetical protein
VNGTSAHAATDHVLKVRVRVRVRVRYGRFKVAV